MNEITPQAGPLTTEELFRLHGVFVERFLARLGVPAEHAEDALQDVFLVVHRNGGYRPGLAKPTSYLAGIALHAAYRHRRRERVDRSRHTDASTEHVPSTAADPTRTLMAHEELERLQLALERLPEDLRTTLVLVDIEGESCLSVAAALDMPVGTVYSRLHIARKKLQLALHAVELARTRPRATSLQAERRRALGVPSLGMFAWLGFDPLFARSEAGRLLRLARVQPTAASVPETSLLRHRELLQSGADLNVASWAAPHTATWLGVLGPAGIGALASVSLAALTSAWLVVSAQLQPTAAAPLSLREAAPQATAPLPVSAVQDTPATAGPTALASVAGSGMQPTAAMQSARATTRPDREHRPRTRTVSAPEPASAPLAAIAAPRPQAHEGDRAPTPPPRATEDTNDRDEQAPTPPPPAASRNDPHALAALQEMQDIANAERLLARAPARALAIVRSVQARFPDGYLREERAYVELMALQGLGRTEEARRLADAFLDAHPDGPYTRRVRNVAAGTLR